MFLTFEVIATFGVSAVISFTVSSAILLLVAAQRGLLCAPRPTPRAGVNLNTAALLPPDEKAAIASEQTPLHT